MFSTLPFISHNVIPGQRQQTHRTDTQREENRGKLKKDSHEISSADCPRSVEEDDGKVGFHFLRCFRISTRCKDVLILNLPELVNKGRENMDYGMDTFKARCARIIKITFHL